MGGPPGFYTGPERTPILDSVVEPRDMNGLSLPELKQLAHELRWDTIRAVSKTGGHLGSSLGVVELPVAEGGGHPLVQGSRWHQRTVHVVTDSVEDVTGNAPSPVRRVPPVPRVQRGHPVTPRSAGASVGPCARTRLRPRRLAENRCRSAVSNSERQPATGLA